MRKLRENHEENLGSRGNSGRKSPPGRGGGRIPILRLFAPTFLHA
jgi:hypothetical protein